LLRREERERGGGGHQPVGVTLLREFALHEGLCIYIYIYIQVMRGGGGGVCVWILGQLWWWWWWNNPPKEYVHAPGAIQETGPDPGGGDVVRESETWSRTQRCPDHTHTHTHKHKRVHVRVLAMESAGGGVPKLLLVIR
jgi:hypothetical protein